MSAPFPKKEDYEDEEQWRIEANKWVEENIKYPSSDEETPSPEESSSLEEEFEPGEAARIIDNQERVIVQQLFDSIEKEQELERLRKQLEEEKEARRELEKKLKAARRSSKGAGPSRR